MAQSTQAKHLGIYAYGDTAKILGRIVKDRATGAILSLVGATGGTYYCRKVGAGAWIAITPTMGGALGSISFVPGAEATLAPEVGKDHDYECRAEFDLGGKHYTVPDDGLDKFKLRRDR